jgi:hypothetical protein
MVVRECPVNDTSDVEFMIDKYIACTEIRMVEREPMPQSARSQEQFVTLAGLPLTEVTPPRQLFPRMSSPPKPSKTALRTYFHTATPRQSNAPASSYVIYPAIQIL